MAAVCGQSPHAQVLLASVAVVGLARAALAVELIGYLPGYRMKPPYVDRVLPDQLALMNEVRYFGISVDAAGRITTSSDDLDNIRAIRALIDVRPASTRPRLAITIGGAGASDGFSSVAADVILYDRFAKELAELLDRTGAEAVDVDWEHPSPGLECDSRYPAMLRRIKELVGARRRVYATVAPSDMLSQSVLAGSGAIDGISLMTYDLGWWSNDPRRRGSGEHSLDEHVRDAVHAWIDAPGAANQRPWVFDAWGQNAPPSKLGVGVPFYGRGFDGSHRRLAAPYRVLVSEGETSDGRAFLYHGENYWSPDLDLVIQRVRFAETEGLQHIIFWELSQDLPPTHAGSLLRAAFEARRSGR